MTSNSATPSQATLKDLLIYWFGDPSSCNSPEEEKEKWRGGLWFRGLDPVIAKQYPKEAAKQIHKRTDQYIAERFGSLFDTTTATDITVQTLEEQVARVVLWDQMARNAFRGTPNAFAYDGLAKPLALALLRDSANEAYWETNWNYALFLCIALMHAENVQHAKAGLHYLEDIQTKLQAKHHTRLVASRLIPILKTFLGHLEILLRFGRYPSRNAAMGRTSTPEELHYLTSEKIPRWAKSQTPQTTTSSATTAKKKTSTPKKKPLRVLVLHGNRANLRKFKSRVRDTLKGISSSDRPIQLDYIKAPNLYQAQDTEEKQYLEGLGINNNVSSDQQQQLQQQWQQQGNKVNPTLDNRCWWYMNEEGRYVGLEKSIQAVEDWMEESGHCYDGILGFAQGGCMAAILAALQHEGRLRNLNTLQFVISISGFYCRDSRAEFSKLHACLTKDAMLHSPETVQPRQDKIVIPSFHTWGLNDSLIDGWRSEMLSQAFLDPKVEPHPGEHMARGIEHWPIDSIRQWLASLELQEANEETTTTKATETATAPLESFADKFFALKKSVGATAKTNRRYFIAVQHPLGLRECVMNNPFWNTVPESVSEVSYEMLADFVPRLLAVGQDSNQLVDDAMIVAWCFYPFHSERKQRNCRDWNQAGQAFCWMIRLLLEGVKEEEFRKYILDFHLPWIARYSDTWESLVRIDMIFTLGTSEKASPPQHKLPSSQHASKVRSVVADLFAKQLTDDFHKVMEAKEAYSAFRGTRSMDITNEGSGTFAKMQLYQASSLPSHCSDAAPRRGATQKQARLDEAVAEVLTIFSKEARARFPRGSAKNRYRFVLKEIVGFRKEYAAALVDFGSSRDMLHLSDQQWKEAFNGPLSAAILNPIPEPVDIATAEQMAPLHKFLRERPVALMQPEVTFERGTLLEDGRLDLCKQVIGPQGIQPLFQSLMQDENGLVQHLLLGNNVAGDDLGKAVGDFIQSGHSKKLTTWYIAGNRLTVDGIRPVCKALSKDCYVRQLWLKRNPLLPVGMVPIASLLRSNSHLQVLDLTNTGILDEGCCTVMEAMKTNSTIEYLYLDTNGIKAKGVSAIRTYFESTKHKALKGLGLGCNRVGDNGTKDLVEGMKTYGSLKRLTLASCGIGLEGAKCLAEFLTSDEGSELRSLDLGFLKSTFAVGELPNRIQTEGAEVLAHALQSNSSLESLILSNNNIYNAGFVAFAEALRLNHEQSALRHFVFPQPGIPVNELVLEKIRFYVKAKAVAWQKEQESANSTKENFVDPVHLDEIQSVYRVGAKYEK